MMKTPIRPGVMDTYTRACFSTTSGQKGSLKAALRLHSWSFEPLASRGEGVALERHPSLFRASTKKIFSQQRRWPKGSSLH